MSDKMSSELPPSELGTKQYWDHAYDEEYDNFVDHGDSGEVWFGRNVTRRVVRWLCDCKDVGKEMRVMDIGSGNGDLLFELAKAGFSNLTGVDYAESAVRLATAIQQKAMESGNGTAQRKITFQVGNILNVGDGCDGDSVCPVFQQRYNICLDKGTYDAISMDPEDARSKRTVYQRNVGHLLTRDGILVLTSCNWTAEELLGHFRAGFELADEIPMPRLQFGGHQGQTVTSLVLRKKEPT